MYITMNVYSMSNKHAALLVGLATVTRIAAMVGRFTPTYPELITSKVCQLLNGGSSVVFCR
jgi:hypothetical protein